MPLTSSPAVHIVGASIAGLALGRCLLRQGIPYRIFEKRTELQAHVYGIELEERAYRPLLDFFGEEEGHFRRETAVDRIQGGLGLLQQEEGDSSRATFYAEHGAVLRFLVQGQVVSLGHNLTHCSPSRHGLRLAFDNGQSAEASITVDAGGESSGLRRLLCPNVEPSVLPWVAFHGVRSVSRRDYEAEYAGVFGKATRRRSKVIGSDWTVTWSRSYPSESSAVQLRYTMIRPAKRPDDPLYRPDRSRQDASVIPAEFWQEVDRLSTHAASNALHAWLAPSRRHGDRILHWLMRTSLVPPDAARTLAQRGVYAIGDAAYSTPITVSGGANRAMASALALSQALQDDAKPEHFLRHQNALYGLTGEGKVDASRLDLTYRPDDCIQAIQEQIDRASGMDQAARI